MKKHSERTPAENNGNTVPCFLSFMAVTDVLQFRCASWPLRRLESGFPWLAINQKFYHVTVDGIQSNSKGGEGNRPAAPAKSPNPCIQELLSLVEKPQPKSSGGGQGSLLVRPETGSSGCAGLEEVQDGKSRMPQSATRLPILRPQAAQG